MSPDRPRHHGLKLVWDARRLQRYMLWLSVLVSVTLVILWGPSLDDRGYAMVAAARNLASGRGVTFGLDWAGFSPWGSPLPVLLLAALERVSIPLVPALCLFGAVGWGFATYAVSRAASALGYAAAAPVATAFVAFAPFTGTAVGGVDGWVVALFWWALALTLERRYRAAVCSLAFWLGLYFDWPTWLGITAFLVAARLRERRLLWGLVLLWGAASVRLAQRVLTSGLSPSLLHWRGHEVVEMGLHWLPGDAYWLFIPLATLGALTGSPPVLIALLGWGSAAVIGAAPTSVIGLYAVGAVAVALGCAWLADRGLSTRDVPPTYPSLALGALLLALPLLVARGSTWLAAYQARPVVSNTIKSHAGEWLYAHSAPGDVVWGELQVGVAAERPVIAWEGEARGGRSVAPVLAALSLHPPAFCVSSHSIAWDSVTHTGWFEARYEPVQHFGSAVDSGAGVTVWRYREGGYDRGEPVPVDLQLGQEMRVVGYQSWPPSLRPGEPVYLTLFLRAETPVSEAPRAIVRVYSPFTGENYAQTEHAIPTGIPVEWWLPGEVIAERFVLTTTAATPVGAYHLDLSVPDTEVQGVKLAYVSVPWEGSIPSEAQPVGARFEGGMLLAAAQLPKTLAPGSEVEVTLYWEAEAAPMEDVTVFVHLLGPEGEYLSGHDGMPMEGRYPTGAWQPGDQVPDSHRLRLPETLPLGRYQLVVGLYDPATMERLTVETADGDAPPDRVIILGSFESRE